MKKITKKQIKFWQKNRRLSHPQETNCSFCDKPLGVKCINTPNGPCCSPECSHNLCKNI